MPATDAPPTVGTPVHYLVSRGAVKEWDPFRGSYVYTHFNTESQFGGTITLTAGADARRALLERLEQDEASKERPRAKGFFITRQPETCPVCGGQEKQRPRMDPDDKARVWCDPDIIESPTLGYCYHYDADGNRVHQNHWYCKMCRATDDFTAARLERVVKMVGTRKTIATNARGQLVPEFKEVKEVSWAGYWLADSSGNEVEGYGRKAGFTPIQLNDPQLLRLAQERLAPTQKITAANIAASNEQDAEVIDVTAAMSAANK